MMQPAKKIVGLALSLCCVGALAATQQSDNSNGSSSAQSQTSTAADNSRINTRDQNGAMMTPQNQPNAAGDRKVLAAVRRTVVRDKSLSSSAHNVKILVSSGVVTLRGPVKNDDEKSKVEKLAQQVAGVSSVDNQLDVKND
jgi:hyperosmotically inducible protein